ncbi:hypothetical protein EJ08DRAFT_738120 [Tothia fuscella]|uniref:Uncharacterized protein n=1 Tax=Tothia fuscella TaxID=1048955 RepID=A0A9P4NHR3_9PEZI|nr:hypothetical protein EJ08DRAFT_738120 [Tothia fuscella]
MTPTLSEKTPMLSKPPPSKKRKRAQPPQSTTAKLPKLPSNARITKRPLLHPAIPSRFSHHPRVIYISPRTPFASTVRRIRTTLSTMQKRRTQSIFAQSANDPLSSRRGHDRVLAAAVGGADREARRDKDGMGEDVVLVKGAGRGVEKVLELAGFFEREKEKEGVVVRMGSGSEWVVDDVVVVDGDKEEKNWDGENGDKDERNEDGEGVQKEEEEVPESRVRMVSVLEVRIGLR